MFTSERNECKSVHIQYDPNFKLKKKMIMKSIGEEIKKQNWMEISLQ